MFFIGFYQVPVLIKVSEKCFTNVATRRARHRVGTFFLSVLLFAALLNSKRIQGVIVLPFNEQFSRMIGVRTSLHFSGLWKNDFFACYLAASSTSRP